MGGYPTYLPLGAGLLEGRYVSVCSTAVLPPQHLPSVPQEYGVTVPSDLPARPSATTRAVEGSRGATAEAFDPTSGVGYVTHFEVKL